MSRPKMSTTCVPPDLGGKTPMERFERILKQVISVPRDEIDRAMAKEQRHRRKRKHR